MQVKVKDGDIHIPTSIWKKAHLPQDGSYEVEVSNDQIVIRAQSRKKDKGRIRSIRKLGFVGMWADRDDMANSQEWVRKQRAGWRQRAKVSG
jgi:antitoxin component of MazEF toxin-antitoxin module